MRSIQRDISIVLFSVAVISTTNAALTLFATEDAARGYTIYRAVSLAIAAFLLLFRFKTIIRVWVRERWALLLALWSTATLAWTDSVSDSLPALGLTMTAMVVSAAMVLEMGAAGSARLVAWLLTICSILSVVYITLAPTKGAIVVLHPTEGLTRQAVGIFGWNSELGIAASTGAVLMAALWAQKPTAPYALGSIANLVALLLTDSATSIIAAAGGLLLVVYLSGRLSKLVIAVGAATLTLWVTVQGVEQAKSGLLDLLKRSSDLSGRQEIWSATITLIADRPLLGHGAGTTPDFLAQIGRDVHHAHSGYLQLAYDRGIIGVLLLSLMLVASGVRLWRIDQTHTIIVAPVLVTVLVANYANNFLAAAGIGAFLIYWSSFATYSRSATLGTPKAIERTRDSRRSFTTIAPMATSTPPTHGETLSRRTFPSK